MTLPALPSSSFVPSSAAIYFVLIYLQYGFCFQEQNRRNTMQTEPHFVTSMRSFFRTFFFFNYPNNVVCAITSLPTLLLTNQQGVRFFIFIHENN